MTNNHVKQGHVSKLDALFDCIESDKKLVEKALCDACAIFPGIQELRTFINRYQSLYKEPVDIEEVIARHGTGTSFEDGLGKQNEKVENASKKKTCDDPESSKGKNKTHDDSVPTFNLGISSQESDEDTVKIIDRSKPVDMDEQLDDEEQLVWSYLVAIWENKKEDDRNKGKVTTKSSDSVSVPDDSDNGKLYT